MVMGKGNRWDGGRWGERERKDTLRERERERRRRARSSRTATSVARSEICYGVMSGGETAAISQ